MAQKLDQKIFENVAGSVGAALAELGYERVKNPESDPEGPVAVYTATESAYGILYRESQKRFELRSCGLEDGNPDGQWKSVSLWLFDPETDSQAQAQSIVDDFIETVRGPKQLAAVKARKKRKKDDENNADPLFFFNRFVNVFPELKDEITAERGMYGEIRTVTFARASLLPRIAAVCANPGEKDRAAKCCTLLNDLYVAGDMDVRSLITIVILNGLSPEALEVLRPTFSAELAKSYKSAAKLKGKKIKPEKKKKHKNFMAQTLNNMDH